jgi:hypothetical protein
MSTRWVRTGCPSKVKGSPQQGGGAAAARAGRHLSRLGGQDAAVKVAANGHETVAQLLLAKDGVDPNSKATGKFIKGLTPLWLAAGYGHEA